MIRVAILGAGIGREHLAAYEALPDLFDVAMIIDRDLARAEDIAGGRFRCETSLDQAMGAGVDMVDICLPPTLHVPVAIQALNAGKHVICEKPLATSLADADRLAQATGPGRQVFPVFQYRWGPAFAQLRALIAAGITGAPQVAALETHWSRDAAYYASRWRGTWAGEQGGALVTHAIHNHDLLTHFFGPIAAVSAMATTRVNPIETEDCLAICLQMANGALASSSITLGAARDETRLRLVFEHVTATSGTTPYAPGMDPWTFTARDPARQGEVDRIIAQTPSEPVGFQGFFTAIHGALNGRGQAVTLDDGVASLALITAAYDAVRSGARVSLPLPTNHPLYKGWSL